MQTGFTATYSLSISAPRFKRHLQSDIAINTGEQPSLGTIRLAVGETAESVTVTADAAPVNPGASDRAGALST